MTDVELSRLLQDLSRASKRSRKKSDSINSLIEQLTEKLRELEVGREVWVIEQPMSSKPWEELDEDGTRVVRCGTRDTELGFARVGDRWHLMVRSATYNRNDDGQLELLHTDDEEPLENTSRRMRVEALKLFPELVKAIEAQADEASKAVEDPKKLPS
jgi:hypothetical protein